jgi:hypothetical protein
LWADGEGEAGIREFGLSFAELAAEEKGAVMDWRFPCSCPDEGGWHHVPLAPTVGHVVTEGEALSVGIGSEEIIICTYCGGISEEHIPEQVRSGQYTHEDFERIQSFLDGHPEVRDRMPASGLLIR